MRSVMVILLGLLVLGVAACGGDRKPGSDLPSVSQLPPPDDGNQPAPVPPVPPTRTAAAAPPASAPAPAPAPAPVPVASVPAAPAAEPDGWSDADFAFLQKRVPLYEQSLDQHLSLGDRLVAAEATASSIDRQRALAGSAAQQAQQLKHELLAMQQQLATLRGTDGAVDTSQFAALDSRLSQLDQKLTALDARVQRLLVMRVSPQSNYPR